MADDKTPYDTLPEPTLNFSPSPATGEPPPFPAGTPTALLASIEPSLETGDLNLLTTGASGAAQTAEIPDFDTRVNNFDNLPNGPFPLAGANLPYDSYTGDTTHRLFEMWQQSDCNLRNATRQNPSGCLNDLYPFVITTYTSEIDPSSFPIANQVDDNGGGNSMAFYNMQKGDVPVLKSLADQYSMSDNFHQSVMGGTGANHVMLGTGDAIFWSDGQGNPTTPPSHIANPNPLPGSNNQYTVDIGFDGNFTECADPTQPGIKPIRDYLKSLPYDPKPNCEPATSTWSTTTARAFCRTAPSTPRESPAAAPFPRPTSAPSANRSTTRAFPGPTTAARTTPPWHSARSKRQVAAPPIRRCSVGAAYCNICNFESYTNAIMGDTAQRTAHIKDATDFFAAVDDGSLPAVSFVKPDGLLDGHPASSKLDLFEAMAKKIVDHLTANPELFASTVLFVTMDEGGGYYDSGYIQPLDFFGDGPRIPLIAVSPFTRGGHISHSYTDHVSILKFIERNWDLKPLTHRSRDNFPNPVAEEDNPYVPVNTPAIGDLFDLFDFGHHDGDRGGDDQGGNH